MPNELTTSPLSRIEILDADFTSTTHQTDDPKITGSQIIEASGKRPPAEYLVLQQLKNREMETTRPNETVDLREQGVERFFVIKSDRSFRFIVDGLNLEWALPEISVRHTKLLAGLQETDRLVLIGAAQNTVLEENGKIRLDASGVEEVRILKVVKVKVFYSEEPFFLEARNYTTEELIKEFGVPEGYILNTISEDCDFNDLAPGQILLIKEGMKFSSHPPRGQSS